MTDDRNSKSESETGWSTSGKKCLANGRKQSIKWRRGQNYRPGCLWLRLRALFQHPPWFIGAEFWFNAFRRFHCVWHIAHDKKPCCRPFWLLFLSRSRCPSGTRLGFFIGSCALSAADLYLLLFWRNAITQTLFACDFSLIETAIERKTQSQISNFKNK